MFDTLRQLFRRRPPEPCRHPETISDRYRDQVVVTCCRCAEVWLSGLPMDWTPEPALPEEPDAP
jgi:hypothetical protein